jgi:hypothetical protein
MNTEIRHFILTGDGGVREFSAEQAAMIAAGANKVPEFADLRLRYLQVSVDTSDAESGLKIQTAGGAISFDAEGRLAEAAPPNDREIISRFEHDTCVQWALGSLGHLQRTLN